MTTLLEYLEATNDAMARGAALASDRTKALDDLSAAEGRLADAIEKRMAVAVSGPTIQAQRPPWAPPNYLPIGSGRPGEQAGGGGPGAGGAPGPADGAAASPGTPEPPPVYISTGVLDAYGRPINTKLPNFAPAGMKMGSGDSAGGDQLPAPIFDNLPPVSIDTGVKDAYGKPITRELPRFARIGESRPGAGVYFSGPGGPAEPPKHFPGEFNPVLPVGRVGNDPRFPLIPSAPSVTTGSFGTGSTVTPKSTTSPSTSVPTKPTPGETQIVKGLDRIVTKLQQVRDDARQDGGLELRRRNLL